MSLYSFRPPSVHLISFNCFSYPRQQAAWGPSIHNDRDATMATSMWARRETTSWRAHCSVASPRLSLAMAGSCGAWPPIPKTSCTPQPGTTSTWQCGARTNWFGPYRRATSASHSPSIRSARRWLPAARRVTCWSSTVTTELSCWRCVFVVRHWTVCPTIRVRMQMRMLRLLPMANTYALSASPAASSWRYDCHGLAERQHLSVPSVARWILLQEG